MWPCMANKLLCLWGTDVTWQMVEHFFFSFWVGKSCVNLFKLVCIKDMLSYERSNFKLLWIILNLYRKNIRSLYFEYMYLRCIALIVCNFFLKSDRFTRWLWQKDKRIGCFLSVTSLTCHNFYMRLEIHKLSFLNAIKDRISVFLHCDCGLTLCFIAWCKEH